MPKETDLPVKLSTKGRCEGCGGQYSKSGNEPPSGELSRASGSTRFADGGSRRSVKQGKLLHLVVQGHDDPIYWLHLEVPGSTTLLELDKFLRDYWLECCGHLSAYEIEGVRYAVMPDREYGLDEKSM